MLIHKMRLKGSLGLCGMLGVHRCGVAEAWAELRCKWVYVVCWKDIDVV